MQVGGAVSHPLLAKGWPCDPARPVRLCRTGLGFFRGLIHPHSGCNLGLGLLPGSLE